MEIDVNTKFELIPESVFKEKITNMLLKLNKSMGNSHTGEEISYVAVEIWKRVYYNNKAVPLGTLYRYYDDVLAGYVPLKKLTVQSVLSSLQDYCYKFKESNRINLSKMINEKERKQAESGLYTSKAPIGAAACWMITKRCDGLDVDHLTTRQVAECIEKGVNPDKLLSHAR